MKKPILDPAQIRSVILDTNGASCSNCARAVEHVGAKIAGVQSIQVDRLNNAIHVEYDGRPETIAQIVDIVDRLGYSAVQRS